LTGLVARMGRQGMYTEFWWGNFLENGFLEHEGNQRITVKWILGKWMVKIGDRWNWLQIMPIGGLWY
jgi:hypothetical protein